MNFYKLNINWFKTTFDILFSIVFILFGSPLFIIIGLLIYRDIGSPVIFKQVRPGFNKKPFVIYKFRTMTNEMNEKRELLKDDARITKLGKILRSTSLDELPEFINVLKGDMSIVGPRPLLMRYLDRYTTEQARRHEVKPGITGWAQVNGRNAISWDDKFKMDVWYVDNQSLALDIKIIFKTIMKVFKREGINEPGGATMAEFMGSEGSMK